MVCPLNKTLFFFLPKFCKKHFLWCHENHCVVSRRLSDGCPKFGVGFKWPHLHGNIILPRYQLCSPISNGNNYYERFMLICSILFSSFITSVNLLSQTNKYLINEDNCCVLPCWNNICFKKSATVPLILHQTVKWIQSPSHGIGIMAHYQWGHTVV